MTYTRVRMTVDPQAPGKHAGEILVPISTNDSAYGLVGIPVVTLHNGEGPSVLLTGAIHGDEYEGPVILRRLASELAPERIRGTIVILPYCNLPALRAGARVSPLDNLNLNRIFPGNAGGGPSEMLAHFICHFLLPAVDIVIDLHSGGRSLLYLPLAATHLRGDADTDRRAIAALQAFGAPIGLLSRDVDSHGLFDYTAESMGKLVVSTELGGGGIYDPDAARIGHEGVWRQLHHFGLIESAPAIRTPSRIMHMPDNSCFSRAMASGLYEPCVQLGGEVRAGDLLGLIHGLDDFSAPPAEVRAETSGLLICRRGPGLIAAGDCAAIVARDHAEH